MNLNKYKLRELQESGYSLRAVTTVETISTASSLEDLLDNDFRSLELTAPTTESSTEFQIIFDDNEETKITASSEQEALSILADIYKFECSEGLTY